MITRFPDAPSPAEDRTLIIVLGSGDPAGDLPDPGRGGFALQELHPGSIHTVELEDGRLLITGEARAVRGEPPLGSEGCVIVYPTGRFELGWF